MTHGRRLFGRGVRGWALLFVCALLCQTISGAFVARAGSGDDAMTMATQTTNMMLRLRSFAAQRKVASDLLLEAAGLGATAQARVATILNPNVLRRACVLGTLQMIYSALAAVIPSDGEKDLVARAALCAKLYRQAIGAAKVEVDLDGDGKADEVRTLSIAKLVRV